MIANPPTIPDAQALARSLSLDSLRLLAVVLREGSIAAASRIEPLTASAISKRMAQLEQVLGCPLMQRSGERLEPTAAGRIVLAQWGRIENELLQLAGPVAAPDAHRGSACYGGGAW